MQHLPTQRASSVNERRMSEHNKMIKLIHQKKGNAIFIHRFDNLLVFIIATFWINLTFRGSIVESEPTELSVSRRLSFHIDKRKL